jgi:hypothetical protein
MAMTRTHSTHAVPPGKGVTIASVPGVQDEARNALNALIASGASRWSAIGQIANAFGAKSVRDEWDGYLEAGRTIYDVLEVLEEVAIEAPDTACTWLKAGWRSDGLILEDDFEMCINLSGRKWVTELPAGMKFEGRLILRNTGIRSLSSGMRVGMLDLGGSPIVSLPKDLRVKAGLDLRGCTEWDGIMPLRAKCNFIFTDGHENGVQLANWRFMHPHGEKAGDR